MGFARTSYDPLEGSPVVGFDMGGTVSHSYLRHSWIIADKTQSTDVSRFSGDYEHVFGATTAGITIQVPQLDINTVAAGGGSILTYRNGIFHVGPESAGAHPGPACYRKGGPLTITDANLFLGRLHIESFPKSESGRVSGTGAQADPAQSLVPPRTCPSTTRWSRTSLSNSRAISTARTARP